MKENLKVTHYRNGDAIPTELSGYEWANTEEGSYAAFGHDVENIDTYGYLYNWYAVNDERNICPEGWRVSSDADWLEMEVYMGMDTDVSEDIGWRGDISDKLRSTGTNYWWEPNSGATNESVFSVKGTSIHDHGNAHGKEGFCLMARAAWVKGEIKDNILHVDKMKLVSH